ncbi:hypothetical protein GCM10027275_28260 [Rhabdobacter roseus]|uniref:Glycosyltransferase involved in cell wall biosynthesis n=1 Tax=Rhabdobacter roseus TaxID=1655419 RepID=A0A840TN21_9BACT|nr:glycosyltransferase [Rhabdobacter roseus]MBB5284774.1 glycosyltransferase involved in cell wall biosynthesis [Rhabdobacter roseus]
MSISTKRRILFFTPFATRTGSEMMLLYILRHLDRTRFEAGLVSFAKGELLEDLPSDIPVFIAPRQFTLPQKVAFHLGFNPTLMYLRKLARTFKADLWYVNTIMLPETITVAREFSIPVVTHFHELPLTYIYLSDVDFKSIVEYSTALIGCSGVTCQAIRDAGGKRVHLVHEFIDDQQVKIDFAEIQAIRKELEIAENDFVWVMSGMTSERKGFDLLPDIASLLDDPHVHLIWVGARINDGLVYYTEQRLKNSTSRTKVHLVGKQKERYYSYLGAGNGFLLTSRQDPFPLVMIEAALLGKPIAAFPSGGVSEFVLENMGAVTNDFSVRQLVEAMHKIRQGTLKHNPSQSRERARQFNIQNGIAQWETTLEKLL